MLVYALFTSILLVFLTIKDHNLEVVTRWLVVLFLGLQFIFLPFLKSISSRLTPKWRFIVLSTLFAMAVEGFHMISNPVDKSLIISANSSVVEIVRNYAIDLLFTTPVYVIVFLIMWFFIKTYAYSLWEFVLVMGLSQALGDGSFYFAANPIMLVFIPYIALNYNAMHIAPYLLVKKEISPRKISLKRYLPLIIIPIIYVIGSFLIKIIAHSLGIF